MSDKYFGDVIGNRTLTERLSRDIRENKLAHAYILEGPRGSGRHTLALNAAAALCCEKEGDSIPCKRCRNCEKIFGSKSPDVITVGLEDDKSFIGIETVRFLCNDIHVAPNDLKIKVYIIEDADLMTIQAQNAFLLSLEEPPSYILFFLLCENSTNLLETVRSRAPSLRTEKLSADQVEDYLLAHEKKAVELKETNAADFKTLISVSAGSIGYAIELLDARKRKQIFEYRKTAEKLITMLSSRSKQGAIEAISLFGNKRADVLKQISFLQYAIRDLLLLKKHDEAPLCFFEDRESANELSTHFTATGLFALYDASVIATADLEANANVRLTVMNMMRSAKLI